jgi:hypothetical protein
MGTPQRVFCESYSARLSSFSAGKVGGLHIGEIARKSDSGSGFMRSLDEPVQFVDWQLPQLASPALPPQDIRAAPPVTGMRTRKRKTVWGGSWLVYGAWRSGW